MFVAHKWAFEAQWLEGYLHGHPSICTYKAALRVWPDAPGYSNQVLRYWLRPKGFSPAIAGTPHRALPDAYVTAFVLRELLEMETVEELIAWFGLGGIALEWHEDLRPWLDHWITHGVLADVVWGDPPMDVWSGDGRLTAGHLAALRRWAAAGLLITLIDRTRVARPRPGESEKEMGRQWWSERDAAMAGRVLAAPDAPGGRLVVAGDLHTRLEPLPASDPVAAEIGVPMGAELARRRAGLRSINSVYGPGQFYNLGPRRSDLDGLLGQHIDTPRLIMQHSALLLQVPSPREATVPHRELPCLSFG